VEGFSLSASARGRRLAETEIKTPMTSDKAKIKTGTSI
jgi:hypothetical protein